MGIYIEVHDQPRVQVKTRLNPSNPNFPSIINILNMPPQSQRSDADGETGEESEGGADGHPHHNRNGRCIAEFVAGVEAGEVPKQAVALCVVVEVAESVEW